MFRTQFLEQMKGMGLFHQEHMSPVNSQWYQADLNSLMWLRLSTAVKDNQIPGL
jgi:hypothetical protein